MSWHDSSYIKASSSRQPAIHDAAKRPGADIGCHEQFTKLVNIILSAKFFLKNPKNQSGHGLTLMSRTMTGLIGRLVVSLWI